MSRLDDAVAEFLSLDKVAEQKFRWSNKGHPDYSEAQSRLAVEQRGDLYGKLILTSHKSRNPHKYSFSVIFRTHRVLGLDVSPGHYHYNVTTLESISGTHWQRWPSLEAILDERNLTHHQWLDEILKKAHIRYDFPYMAPPFGEQIGFDYEASDLA